MAKEKKDVLKTMQIMADNKINIRTSFFILKSNQVHQTEEKGVQF